MTWPVAVTPEARADYDEAFDWYNNNSRPNRAPGFVAAVRDVYRRLAVNPFIHQKVYGEVRRKLLKGFPYAVLYVVDPNCVQVIAVHHTSRDPAIWQSRVGP